KALELDPRNPESHDLRATILATTGRFADARDACTPAIFGRFLPPLLRARAAWITAREGRLRDAIAAMRDVVATDQSNYWAWQRLAEWLNEVNEPVQYLSVCRRMAELWPHDAATL